MSVVKAMSSNSHNVQLRTCFITVSLTMQCNPDFLNLQRIRKLFRNSGSSRCRGETTVRQIQEKGIWFEL